MTVTFRPSIRRIAEDAGVSRTTVSRVLNGHAGEFSDDTRQRVLDVVRKLNYAPVAQPTTQHRHVETRTIGLVFDCIEAEDFWGLQTYYGLLRGAREHGYDLLTLLRAPADWMVGQEDLQFLDRRTDGLVFLVPKDRERVFQTLLQHKIPAVSCYVNDVPPGIATIVFDNAGTMQQATESLIEKGHKNILHVAGLKERTDFRDRLEGYQCAMRAANLPAMTVQIQNLEDNTWLTEIEKLLAGRALTAIVCAADHYALRVWQLANSLGISVPGELSIVGMDDQPGAAHASLTTYGYSCATVGYAAMEAMTRLLAGDDYRECSRVLQVDLVERGSVAEPRRK